MAEPQEPSVAGCRFRVTERLWALCQGYACRSPCGIGTTGAASISSRRKATGCVERYPGAPRLSAGVWAVKSPAAASSSVLDWECEIAGRYRSSWERHAFVCDRKPPAPLLVDTCRPAGSGLYPGLGPYHDRSGSWASAAWAPRPHRCPPPGAGSRHTDMSAIRNHLPPSRSMQRGDTQPNPARYQATGEIGDRLAKRHGWAAAQDPGDLAEPRSSGAVAFPAACAAMVEHPSPSRGAWTSTTGSSNCARRASSISTPAISKRSRTPATGSASNTAREDAVRRSPLTVDWIVNCTGMERAGLAHSPLLQEMRRQGFVVADLLRLGISVNRDLRARIQKVRRNRTFMRWVR